MADLKVGREPATSQEGLELEMLPTSATGTAVAEGKSGSRVAQLVARWPFRSNRHFLEREIRRGLTYARTLRMEGATRFANFIVQRIFRINADAPWPIHYTSRVIVPRRIKVGTGVSKSLAFSPGIYLQGLNGIEIGEGTLLGPGVKVISANHVRGDISGHMPGPPVIIGRRCWIGANAIILPGAELGDDCTVGAGAVVTRPFPARSVIVGNPARTISRGQQATKLDSG